MVPTLMARAGAVKGAAFPLDRTETTVGRDEANCVVLADGSVAPRHCVLVRREGQVTLHDVDPANPSFVNGLPASDRRLEHGDRIQIGASTFVFTVDGVAAVNHVQVGEGLAEPPSMIVMRREDALIGNPSTDE